MSKGKQQRPVHNAFGKPVKPGPAPTPAAPIHEAFNEPTAPLVGAPPEHDGFAKPPPERKAREPGADQLYVICVPYGGEWDRLRDLARRVYPGCIPMQELPLQRLAPEHVVRAAFYIGENGQMMIDEGDKEVPSRRPYCTEPVRVDAHWTPGEGGIGGDLNRATFLEELGKLCLPNGGAEGGVSIKSNAETLRVGYG